MSEEHQFDPRQMPMSASVTLGEFGDELRGALSDILYVDGLDQLPALVGTLQLLVGKLEDIPIYLERLVDEKRNQAIEARQRDTAFLEVLTSIADRLSEIRDVGQQILDRTGTLYITTGPASELVDARSQIMVPDPEHPTTFKPVKNA